jgi:hypothetical protein
MDNKFLTKQVENGAAALRFNGQAAMLVPKVHEFFTSRGYKLKSGTPGNGLYEYGNYTLRILFGAFVKYFKFQSFVVQEGEEVSVRVHKGHSGMSGGLIGLAKLNKELKAIAEAMEGLGHDLGMYSAR